MDQSKKNQQPPKGFNKLVILASKSLKSKSQWADKVYNSLKLTQKVKHLK